MSTKIYNGMRSDKPLAEVIAELVKYRETIKPCYDVRKVYGSDNREIHDRLAKEPESTVQLIPVNDGEKDIVLAFVMPQDSMNLAKGMNDEKIVDDIASMTSLVEYGYWDNTDQPVGMPDEEWAERERLWDAALGHKAIKNYGVGFFLCDFRSLIDFDKKDKSDGN